MLHAELAISLVFTVLWIVYVVGRRMEMKERGQCDSRSVESNAEFSRVRALP